MKGFFAVLVMFAIVNAGGYWLTKRLAIQSQQISISSSLVNDEFRPCPTAFNCVNSDAIPTDSHFIVPIADEDGTRWTSLVQTVASMDGAELVLVTDNYAHFSFTEKYLGIVDDVEFHNRPRAKLIAVRSASRVGKIDFGINRRRIENIRVELGL
jgi:uncharacterized protein (DUF1499 family)